MSAPRSTAPPRSTITVRCSLGRELTFRLRGNTGGRSVKTFIRNGVYVDGERYYSVVFNWRPAFTSTIEDPVSTVCARVM